MVIEIGGKDENTILIENLLYVFLMPLFVDMISVIVRQYGISSSSSSITMVIYVISLFVILIRVRKFQINDIALLAGIYAIIALNYIIFPNTREYLLSTDMLIIYLFYFPICVLSVKQITDWSSFLDKMSNWAVVAIGISTFIMVFLDYSEYLVYMGFSYALLPFIACLYRSGRNEKNAFYLILFFIGCIEILIFGARAAILFLLVYVALSEILKSGRTLQYKIFVIVFCCLVAWIVVGNLSNIADFLSGFPIFKDSYFVKNLANGTLFESENRDILYESCINYIQNMGLKVNGFFGDREYCLGFAYPHNIIYELLMSWGWIIGGVLIAGLAVLLIRSLLLKNPELREISLLIIITGFARFIISGSYLIEGKFWVLLFMTIAIVKSGKLSFESEIDSYEEN